MDMHIERIANSASRRSTIGGSDARVLMGDDESAPLGLWLESWGEAETEDLRDKLRPAQTCDCPRASASPVRAAYAEFVAALAGQPPRPIPINADAIDLEDRAAHLGQVISELSVYLAVILDDTAQNVPGRLDLRDAEAVLADL